MKKIGYLLIILGLYCSINGQTRIYQNNRFRLKTNDFNFETQNPYLTFQKDFRVKNWKENLSDLNFGSTLQLSTTYAQDKISVRKSNNILSFSGSMPIYIPKDFHNMPVMKPDSSMHYHMMIKKINGHKIPEPILP